MYDMKPNFDELSLITERGSAGLGHPDYFDESLHASGTERAQRQLGLIAVKDMVND